MKEKNGGAKVKLRKNTRFSPLSIVIFTVLTVWSVILIFALGWALLTTFKGFQDFSSNLFGLPKKWEFANYGKVWRYMTVQTSVNGTRRTVYVEEMFFNSLFVVLSCAFMSSFIPFITAYACSKFPRWIPSRIIYMIVIVCMIVPIIGSLPSEIQMTMNLGLYNTLFVMPWLKSSFLGMYFLIFYNSCKSLSVGYTEAAYVDGANHYQVMFRIVLPMVWSMFSVTFVLGCIGYWNDFNTPLMFMTGHPTVSLGLYIFTQATDVVRSSTPIRFAAAFMSMLPVLIVFIVFRNKIVGQLSLSGGLKG